MLTLIIWGALIGAYLALKLVWFLLTLPFRIIFRAFGGGARNRYVYDDEDYEFEYWIDDGEI